MISIIKEQRMSDDVKVNVKDADEDCLWNFRQKKYYKS